MKTLAALVKKEQNVVVLGDLNCTPWSPLFTELLEKADLWNARKGFGINPTWPSHLPVFLIPIDHVLVERESFRVLNVRRGPYIGSDHYPLIVTLAEARKQK